MIAAPINPLTKLLYARLAELERAQKNTYISKGELQKYALANAYGTWQFWDAFKQLEELVDVARFYENQAMYYGFIPMTDEERKQRWEEFQMFDAHPEEGTCGPNCHCPLHYVKPPKVKKVPRKKKV